MSKESEVYGAYKEGIVRASHIRRDLNKYTTEYYPEKVRGLCKAYIKTAQEIIRKGEEYLDISNNFEILLFIRSIIKGASEYVKILIK